MGFSELHAKDVHGVVIYNTSMKRWTAQNRKDHIVGIQLAGSALHTFKDKKFVISRNCIYFLNQKDDYSVEVYEPAKAFSIHFTTYDKIDTDSFCIPLTVCDEFISILEKAKTMQETGDDLAIMSLLYLFCAKLEQIRQKKYFPKDKRMIAAKEYIDLHYKEKNCLTFAISQSKLSSRRFGELFRENFLTTPNRYITHRRIEHAKTLLVSGLFTIEQIARTCGFSDIYYFSKVFKNLTGIAPSKWTQHL
ncbi:MAG: helix-turn-helix domain-containing protein [Ruminococcaceae bacterium]|nr:helix-turn-helix domain-containing protein [Oscillospiraceae bacterium]